MNRRIGLTVAFMVLVTRLNAQTVAPFDLVRCAARSDMPCLRSRELIAERRRVLDGSAIGVADLGRASAQHATRVGVGGDSAVSVVVAWRPPLIAMPAFRGTADSASIGPVIREALSLGNGAGSERPAISALILTLVAFAWLLVVRLGWRDVEQPTGRDRGTTTRTGAADPASEGAPPRGPEDVTKQTARRTALRR